MSDEVTVSGKSYISSKRASEITGYSQDYIGQLARSGQISAQRVGGLWYILLDSLKAHQEGSISANSHDHQTALAVTPSTDPDSFVGLDGKKYISASRASKLSGYNQDYVGQLARSGQILARQVGNRWYVEEESVTSHKKEKDALLAAVQSEAVGIRKNHAEQVSADSLQESPQTPLRYFTDDRDLMPVLAHEADAFGVSNAGTQQESYDIDDTPDLREISQSEAINMVPIRRNSAGSSSHALVLRPQRIPERYQGKSAYSKIPFVPLAASALTIVIVVSMGFATIRSEAVYSSVRSVSRSASAAAAVTFSESVVSAIERVLTKELIYARDPN